MVKIGNVLYFIPIILLFFTAFLLCILFRRKSKDFVFKFVFILFLVNAILHLLKIFIPTNAYLFDLPYSLSRISFENLCAISVIVFPILVLFKNKYLNDTIVIIGIISSLAAYFIPTGTFNLTLDNFKNVIEVARYYFCHMPLFVGPVLMLYFGLHKLSYRRVYALGGIFLIYMTIVFVNLICLKISGLAPVPWVEIFSRNGFNPAMVFGPQAAMGDTLVGIICAFVPPFFTYISSSGDLAFIPVLWFVFPLLIIATVFTLLLMIYDRKNVKKDYYYIYARIRLKLLARKKGE